MSKIVFDFKDFKVLDLDKKTVATGAELSNTLGNVLYLQGSSINISRIGEQIHDRKTITIPEEQLDELISFIDNAASQPQHFQLFSPKVNELISLYFKSLKPAQKKPAKGK